MNKQKLFSLNLVIAAASFVRFASLWLLLAAVVLREPPSLGWRGGGLGQGGWLGRKVS